MFSTHHKEGQDKFRTERPKMDDPEGFLTLTVVQTERII